MNSNYQTIAMQVDDLGILTINLNRPDKLNALNKNVLLELSQAFSEAAQSTQIKALLITGNGKAFCAGADINELAAVDSVSGLEFARTGQQVFRQLETLGKPSLAAVNGFAFGGGCELAMAASIRIASEKAQFGQPEVKLGVIPGYGGTQRLARLVGKGRAIDLCTTGRFIDAKTALQWGLVTDLCAPADLEQRAKEILTGIIAMAPLAIKHVLHTIDAGFDMSLDEALDLEATRFALCCASEDKTIGAQAFLDKTAAKFTGK